MIDQAIQFVLNPILDAYSPIVDSDTFPSEPFLVHQTAVTDKKRDKGGIYAIEYALVVALICNEVSLIDSLGPTVVNAIEEMEGDTVQLVVIEESRHESTGIIQFDNEKQKFIQEIKFSITIKK